MLEELARQRIVGGELLQHVLVGRRRAARGLAPDRQAELAEQDLADLLRAAEVERLAGDVVGLLLERGHALGELLALRREQRRVDQDAGALDPAEHARGRHLDAPVDVGQARLGLDLRPSAWCTCSAMSASSHEYSAARETSTCANGIWLAPLPQTSFVGERGAAEVAKGQALERVRLVRLPDVALEHRVVDVAAHVDAERGEDVAVVLGVVADLGRRRVLEPRPQARDDGLDRELVGRAGVAVRDRDVARLARRDREREADQAGADRVERIGLDVERGERRQPRCGGSRRRARRASSPSRSS